MDISSDKLNPTEENLDIDKKRGNIKRKAEFLLIAAQNNAINTNYAKIRLENTKRNKIANVGYVVRETERSIS